MNKLSDRLKQQESTGLKYTELIPLVESLESDSQMLEDLIEIMGHQTRLELSNDVVSERLVWCHISHNIAEKGNTPRQAIVSAIKAWKEINKHEIET